MSELMRRWMLRVLVLIGMVSSGLLIYGASAPIEIRQPVSDETTIALRPGVVAAQSFIAYFPGLNRISVQVARLPAGAEHELNFWLNAGLPGEEGTLLRTPDVDIEYDQGWVHFRFPPQQAEGFRRYIFYVGTFSSEEVVLLGHSADMYPQGSLINSLGDLTFEAGFRPSAEKTITVMLSRLTSSKPVMGGSPPGYFAILIATAACAYSLIEIMQSSKN